MRDVAKEAYEKCHVGSSGWMRPDPTKGESVAEFQAVVKVAQTMESDGLIVIDELHLESQSGSRHVDAICFTRMR